MIVDTGPLVALFNKRDANHEQCLRQFKRMHPPLITCEPVVTEAMHLLRDVTEGQEKLLMLFDRKVLDVRFDLREEHAAILALMKKYRNVPMDLADACITRMTEIHTNCRLWSLDGDFSVYRRLGRRIIPQIPRS